MPTRNKKFILWFKETTIKDIPLVGGKNASLGEMYRNLTPRGIRVPNGFSVTAQAYRYFLREAKLEKQIRQILRGLDTHNVRDLADRGARVRQAIVSAELPDDLKAAIVKSYRQLSASFKTTNVDVAVRSSATAEDLPDASFAGQQ